jgi:hypothetical protein
MKSYRKNLVMTAATLMVAIAPALASAQIVDAVNIGLRGLATVMQGKKAEPAQRQPVQASATDRATIERQIDEAVKNLPSEEREVRKAEMLRQVDQAQSQATNMARAAQAFEQQQNGPVGFGEIVRGALGGYPVGMMRQAEVMSTSSGKQAANVIRAVTVPVAIDRSVVMHKLTEADTATGAAEVDNKQTESKQPDAEKKETEKQEQNER